MTEAQQHFLNPYLATLSCEARQAIPKITASHYCADEYNANTCAHLINIGKKTASCSLKAGWEIDKEPLPQVGELSVVLNWAQEPVCIIKLTTVSTCPFNQVPVAFAEAEGEGDGTYDWWRNAHIRFFESYAKEIGTTFNVQSELVLERFKKVFPL